MKMHFPISITEETTCSRRDLRRHCFLVLCLFLSKSSPLCCVDRLASHRHSFSHSTHLYSSCLLFLSCLPVKADQSLAMCISWTDANIWNSLMSPLEFCWCFNLISLQIHHRIHFFFFFLTPWRIHILNWINERLLCGLRICAAECLPVVMLDYGNYGIAV